jgi:hypothetical protein
MFTRVPKSGPAGRDCGESCAFVGRRHAKGRYACATRGSVFDQDSAVEIE